MSLFNLSIKNKLAVSFGTLILLVLFISGLSVRTLSSEKEAFRAYIDEQAARLAMVNDVIDATNARAVSARNLVLVTTPEDAAMEKRAVTAAHEKVAASMARLKKALNVGRVVDFQESTLFAGIESVEARYGPLALNIVGLALDGKNSEAISKMNAECRPLLAGLLNAANGYRAYIETLARQAIDHADEQAAANNAILMSTAALSAVLAVVLAVVITRAVVGPINLAVNVAEKVAAGDLTSKIEALRHDEMGKLLSALRRMNDALVGVVGNVRAGSDCIATGSAQIASGNADLSQRTERQASNLQQTAASMEQMNASSKMPTPRGRRLGWPDLQATLP